MDTAYATYRPRRIEPQHEEIPPQEMETTLKVTRLQDDGHQTIGKMFVMTGTRVDFECYTLELPWRDNKSRISCIPKGTYQAMKLKRSPAFGYEHIWIVGVPNRSGIKIHRANKVEHLRGCIGVGKTLADLDQDGDKDITHSVFTLENLLKHLPDQFTMTIA